MTRMENGSRAKRRIECDAESWRIVPLAQEHVVIHESPAPDSVYLGTPGILVLPSGRLVATFDYFGPGVNDLPGVVKGFRASHRSWHFGRIFTSDDGGRSWTHRADYPFLHARPFIAGDSIYLLGHCDDLAIARSDNEGETWTKSFQLTRGLFWTASATSVIKANGCVYLALEKRSERGLRAWRVADIAPVLMRGRLGSDLTRPENWSFASELVFEDIIRYDKLDAFGVPFLPMDAKRALEIAPGRQMAPIGWLETNVVQIHDPAHYWHDPKGRTFHLWARAHTGMTGYVAIAKVVEGEDGALETMIERAPSGKRMFYIPCPGGQMKFFVLYDEKTERYWLLGTQATDSMRRADLLPEQRYGLPDNERCRLTLHFSKNMVDWCFAGLVAAGNMEKASRHYASMAVDGDDLVILSRSGDERASSAHNGNLITFHRINNFRRLVY